MSQPPHDKTALGNKYFGSISPQTLLLFWEAFTTLSAVLSVVGVSILFAFDAGLKGWMSIIYLTDVIYCLGMLSRVLLDYRNGYVSFNRFKAFLSYFVNGTFVLGLFSVLPFDVLFISFNVYVASFFRLNRLLRCYNIWKFLGNCERKFVTYGYWFQGILYLCLSGLSVHFLACIWYSLACYNRSYKISGACINGSWANNPDDVSIDINLPNSTVLQQYIVSLYWSVATVTTVGYGDIHAMRQSEKFFSLVVMLWGVVMYGYILGGVASTLTNLGAVRGRYAQHFKAIKEYMRNAKISSDLYHKVTTYLEYNWVHKKGNMDQDLLEDLPLSLRNDVSTELYQDLMIKSQYFEGVSPVFLRVLCSKVKELFFLPNEMIINSNETNEYIYFMHKGTAEVIDEDDRTHVIRELRSGDVFGENAIGLESSSNALPVYARTHCTVLALNKTELKELMNILTSEMKVDEEEGEYSQGVKDEEQHEEQLNNVSKRLVDLIRRFPALYQFIFSTVLLPTSKFIIRWNYLHCIVILAICWFYPFQVGFAGYHPSVGYSYAPVGGFLFTLTYLIDVIFLTDIIVSLKKSFITANGYETDAKVVALRYIKSFTFIIDILSLLPLEILAAGINDSNLNWAIAFKLNRLLKLWKIIEWFNAKETSLQYSIAKLRGTKFLLYILLLTHWSACAWFFVACDEWYSCKSVSWAAENNINNYWNSNSSSSLFHNYLISFYWSATTTTSVGYGDIRAVNGSERLLAITVMLLGLWCYGYILGSVAAFTIHSLLPKVLFQERLQIIQQFMRDTGTGAGLTHRVNDLFTLLWQKSKVADVSDGASVLTHLPVSLQQDIKMEECLHLLLRVPFFSDTKNEKFMKQVCLSVVTHPFSTEDVILYHGDISRNLYLVKKGYIEVLSEDLSCVIHTVAPGGHFGELGFLFGTPLTATVRSASESEVHCISYKKIRAILQSFPEIEKHFLEVESDSELLNQLTKSFNESRLHYMYHPSSSSIRQQQDYVEATTNPKKRKRRASTKHSVITGLAFAMGPPLAIASPHPPPLINAALSCIGPREIQSRLTPTILHNYAFKSCVGSQGTLKNVQSTSVIRYMRHNGGGLEDDSRVEVQEGFLETDSTTSQSFHDEDEIDWFSLGLTRYRILNKPLRFANYIWIKGNALFDKVLSYLLLDFSLLVNRNLSSVWTIAGIILSVLAFLSFSIHACYYSSLNISSSALLWLINYSLDIFFFSDMLLKFHKAYYDKEGLLVTEPLQCARHYLKTTFIFDFLASLPTDLLVFLLWPLGLGAFGNLLSLIRINRIIHIYRLVLYFNQIGDTVPKRFKRVELLKLFVYFLLITHLIGCLWFLLSCSCFSEYYCCAGNSWTNRGSFQVQPLIDYSFFYQYITSIYWSTATTTTVGYGDITAHNGIERLFALCIAVLGILFYGTITAYVAASLVNADSGRAHYRERLELMKEYLREHEVQNSLKNRIINHYEYIWRRTKGLRFHDLFNDMPPSLQSDVSLSLYKRAIDQVPLFHNTGIGFTKLLALAMRPVLYLNGEYVIRKGDIGSEMYFISKGSVEIINDDNHGGITLTTLNKGKFFGEISLIFNCKRTASVRALGNCDLFVLTKHDFESALAKYPNVAEKVVAVATERANVVVLTDVIVNDSLFEGRRKSETAETLFEMSQFAATVSKRNSSVWGRIRTSRLLSLIHPSILPAATIEEESEGITQGVVSPTFPISSRERTESYIKSNLWPALRECLTFTISPLEKEAQFITTFGYYMAYISVFFLSYQIFFHNDSVGLSVINYVLDIYFLIEMLIKFHIGYIDSNGLVVLDFRSVALHYLKSPFGFPVDFFSIFPFEIIALFVYISAGSDNVVWFYVKIPHFIRIFRLWSFFSAQGKKLDQKTVIIQILKFTVLITVTTQFVACIWYMLSCPLTNCTEGSWAKTTALAVDPSNFLHYITSLYWAVATMTTVGYGDISATNGYEMFYTIFIMIGGKLLYGFLLGSVASMLANRKKREVILRNKLDSIESYMKRERVSHSLRHRVLNYYHHHWLQCKGINRQTLFDDTPFCMHTEIALATTRKLLQMVPIISSLDGSLLRQLALFLKPCYFSTGENIVSKGDIGHGLYFIYSGSVKVTVKQLEETISSPPPSQSSPTYTSPASTFSSFTAVLVEGQYFGVECLINDELYWSRASVSALSNCHLFLLSKQDFNTLSSLYPEINKILVVRQ